MKRIVVLLFALLIPINARALSVSKINVSGPSEIKQGATAEYFVDISIDGVSLDDLMMTFGAGMDLEYDSNALVIEDITAVNSEVIIAGNPGSREVVGYFDFEKNEVSYATSCSNNAFCNNYRFKLNVYAKSSGSTNLKIKNAGGIFVDLSKGEDLTEDDVIMIENPVDISKSINIIAATTTPTNVPQETVETTQKVTPVIPTVPKIPTTKTTTTESTTITSIVPTSEETTKEKTTDKYEEELKADKEKREKMNKKIFFYGGIGLIVIVLLIIANLIKNKIRDRKLDKALKNL